MDKELAKIYKEAKQDPSLISTMDPNELLSKMNKEKNSYLEDKTSVNILNEIKQFMEDVHGQVLSQMAPDQRKAMLTNLDILKASMEAVKDMMV